MTRIPFPSRRKGELRKEKTIPFNYYIHNTTRPERQEGISIAQHKWQLIQPITVDVVSREIKSKTVGCNPASVGEVARMREIRVLIEQQGRCV